MLLIDYLQTLSPTARHFIVFREGEICALAYTVPQSMYSNVQRFNVPPVIQVLWKGLDHQLHCPFPTVNFSPRIFLSHCHFLKINFYWSIAALGFTYGSVVRNLPAKQETWFQSSAQEDPLDTEMAAAAAELLQSCLTLCNPLDLPGPLYMGFPRQEY